MEIQDDQPHPFILLLDEYDKLRCKKLPTSNDRRRMIKIEEALAARWGIDAFARRAGR